MIYLPGDVLQGVLRDFLTALAGLDLKDTLNVGIIDMLDAVSQGNAKDAVFGLAQGIWTELLPDGATPPKEDADEQEDV